jgi:hypothetical protein
MKNFIHVIAALAVSTLVFSIILSLFGGVVVFNYSIDFIILAVAGVTIFYCLTEFVKLSDKCKLVSIFCAPVLAFIITFAVILIIDRIMIFFGGEFYQGYIFSVSLLFYAIGLSLFVHVYDKKEGGLKVKSDAQKRKDEADPKKVKAKALAEEAHQFQIDNQLKIIAEKQAEVDAKKADFEDKKSEFKAAGAALKKSKSDAKKASTALKDSSKQLKKIESKVSALL